MASSPIDRSRICDILSEGKEGRPLVVLLVGAPGSGKTTFCNDVMSAAQRHWTRICQDIIANGKAGTKSQCLQSANIALKDGKNVLIDRCNLELEQRSEFVKLGGAQVDVHAVVLDLPARVCISRSVKRSGHEGNLQGGKAAAVVNRMLQKRVPPKLNEGFSRITFCHDENNVKNAVDVYSSLGPCDNLPAGIFGQKSMDAKVQQGIMKFLKKVDTDGNGSQNSVVNHESMRNNLGVVDIPNIIDVGKDKHGDDLLQNAHASDFRWDDAPTLAFPSISTSDFQFNQEKASDVIVETVADFVRKVDNVRLILVDLSPKSKMLSLVKGKTSKSKVDTSRFSTHTGDITRLHTEGGLHCNVIANAANWRLKPGGGGVNAAIFSAGGEALEISTKEQAETISPGTSVLVPVPKTSVLYQREGVTYVIHVLGPNMNPQRPNCLKDDYVKGCKILRDAYTSLFENFASLTRSQKELQEEDNLDWSYCWRCTVVGRESPECRMVKVIENPTSRSSEGAKIGVLSGDPRGQDELGNWKTEMKLEDITGRSGWPKGPSFFRPWPPASLDVEVPPAKELGTETEDKEVESEEEVEKGDGERRNSPSDERWMREPEQQVAEHQRDSNFAGSRRISHITLLSTRVPHKDMFGGTWFQLVDGGTKSVNVAGTLKDPRRNEKRRSRGKEKAEGSGMLEDGRREAIDEKTSRGERVVLVRFGNLHLEHKGTGDIKNVTILALGDTILLWSIRTRGLVKNAELRAESREVFLVCKSSLGTRLFGMARSPRNFWNGEVASQLIEEQRNERTNHPTKSSWGSWAHALHKVAMHPEDYKDDVIEMSDDYVVINDLYPKAKKHILVISRLPRVDSLADIRRENLPILKKMHDVGLKWAEKFCSHDPSLVFRLGYHSIPSMRQLHLHVISQDFDSSHLKKKKHWNSFNNKFFRDSIDSMIEIEKIGSATIEHEKLLSSELRCHRCKSAHPNIPRLKSHIATCKSPFPSHLQNGQLVFASSVSSDSVGVKQ
ncbi:Transcription factor bHLH140 [Platanthera guangdongensis]|uniref:Transcription factor bHLH140 n=1 Tax=Platanthera guangdongensis TaxID=2320717 RepID=A0ABR2M900_9ASPA